MTCSDYNDALPKTPANFQPLTPLTFLERAAQCLSRPLADRAWRPAHHLSRSSSARSLQLASALAKRGIGKGDTVSVMLPTRRRCWRRTSACR